MCDSQGVFPVSAGGPALQDSSQLVCLDTILAVVGHMSARIDQVSFHVALFLLQSLTVPLAASSKALCSSLLVPSCLFC